MDLVNSIMASINVVGQGEKDSASHGELSRHHYGSVREKRARKPLPALTGKKLDGKI